MKNSNFVVFLKMSVSPKYFISIIALLLCSKIVLSQDIDQKVFLASTEFGPSTGPDLVVVTIVNCNTNVAKEMLLTVNDLFHCLELELKEKNSKSIKNIVRSNSFCRTFFLQDTEALNGINFDKLNSKKVSKNEKALEKIVIKKHLIDSLIKTDSLRDIFIKTSDHYTSLRRKVSRQISDSLLIIRTLTKTEKNFLRAISDPYYDGREEQCADLRDNTEAENQERLNMIKIWDSYIALYRVQKERYAYVDSEVDRCEKKFFFDYRAKYSSYILAKVLIKHGITCAFGDEDPRLHFGEIFKR